MAEVSASDAVGAGLRLVGPGLRQANIALGLLGAALVLTELAPGAQDNLANTLLLALIRVPFIVIATAALLRLALGAGAAANGGSAGPGGLQWHGLEGRVLAVQALLFLTYVSIGVVWIIVASIGVGVLMSNGTIPKVEPPTGPMTPETAAALMQGPMGPIMLAILAPALIVIVLVVLKLSLALPATAADGEVKVLRAWRLSRGVLWPIFAVSLLTFAISVAFAALGVTLTGVLTAAGAGGGEASLLPQAAAQAVGAIIGLPVSIGGYVHIYMGVRRRGLTQVRDAAG
ncbi:MAG TPA: hypothetical protein VG939_01885 [Caulobacteraceae bacterium]|nr:hypothetical protein [Caulobacteraceae bacterium]